MNAKDFDRASKGNYAGTASRAVHSAWREPEPRLKAARTWVSETIGFDSRIPSVQAKSGAGAEHLLYVKVPVDAARVVRSNCDVSAPENPRRARPRSAPEPLQDSTIEWMTQLPESQRPLQLARLFPRIANKLCILWADPLHCNGYLASLLMDSRDGGREGFPMQVAGELAELLDLVDAPAKNHPWRQVKDTR